MLSPGEKETGSWGVAVAIIAAPFLVLGYEVSGGNWWIGAPVALFTCWCAWLVNCALWNRYEAKQKGLLAEARAHRKAQGA